MNASLLRSLAAVAAVLLASSPAAAVLVYVEYIDINPPTSSFPNAGGPHWTGFVNTDNETLTIQTWTEIPGSQTFFTPWIPDLSTPLVWHAVDANGDSYNVPETFDGTIDGTFAFISPISALNMEWVDGEYRLPAVADFFPGWGGVRRPAPGQNPPVLVWDVAADQHTMPLLPFGLPTDLAHGAIASTGATVIISNAGPQGVPEAPASLMAALGSAVGLGAAWAGRLLARRRRKAV